MAWKCPNCGSTMLTVTVTTEAKLIQYAEEENFETEVEGDHVWDGDSLMTCHECAQLPSQGGEAVAWHTEDHLTDKSATTYDPEVAKRWRAKGWPVTPLYTHPADQVADGVTVSRERLEHWADRLEDSESNGYGWEDALAAELRALMNGGRDE